MKPVTLKPVTIALGLCLLALSLLAGCATAPAPGRPAQQSYTLESEQVDNVTGRLTINLRLNGPATEAEVRSIAERVIATRSEQYRAITVKSYLAGAELSDPPFALSRLEAGAVTHRVNAGTGSQKIPTH